MKSNLISEFKGNFKKLLSDNNIELFVFDKNISPNATSIIERFNKTLRQKIDKYMSAYKTKQMPSNVLDTNLYATLLLYECS